MQPHERYARNIKIREAIALIFCGLILFGTLYWAATGPDTGAAARYERELNWP